MKAFILICTVLAIAGYFVNEVRKCWIQDESEENENPALKDRYKYPKK